MKTSAKQDDSTTDGGSKASPIKSAPKKRKKSLQVFSQWRCEAISAHTRWPTETKEITNTSCVTQRSVPWHTPTSINVNFIAQQTPPHYYQTSSIPPQCLITAQRHRQLETHTIFFPREAMLQNVQPLLARTGTRYKLKARQIKKHVRHHGIANTSRSE